MLQGATGGGRRCRVERRRCGESGVRCCKGGGWWCCNCWATLLPTVAAGATIGGSPCYGRWVGVAATGRAAVLPSVRGRATIGRVPLKFCYQRLFKRYFATTVRCFCIIGRRFLLRLLFRFTSLKGDFCCHCSFVFCIIWEVIFATMAIPFCIIKGHLCYHRSLCFASLE